MKSRGSGKQLDPQVEVLCRLLAEILARITKQQALDKPSTCG